MSDVAGRWYVDVLVGSVLFNSASLPLHQGVVSGGRSSWWQHSAAPPLFLVCLHLPPPTRLCLYYVLCQAAAPLTAHWRLCHLCNCCLATNIRGIELCSGRFELYFEQILMFFAVSNLNPIFLVSTHWHGATAFEQKIIYLAESPLQLLTLHLVKMWRWWQRRLCSRDVYSVRGVQGLGRSAGCRLTTPATAYMLAHHAAAHRCSRWIITE